MVRMHNTLPKSASSTHLGWLTPVVFGKTSSTRRALRIRSRRTPTLSLPFSFLPMAPSRVSVSIPTLLFPFYPPSSLEPHPITSPSYSPTLLIRSIRTSSGIFSQRYSSTLLNDPITLQRKYLELKGSRTNENPSDGFSRSGEGQRAGRLGSARGSL